MNLLAADIGGTKTLLGIYKFDSKIKLMHKVLYKSNEWNSFELILKNFLNELPKTLNTPIKACIGVAGHVKKGKVNLTNLNWEINEETLQLIIGCEELKILNDFSCLIYSIPFLEEDQYAVIKPYPETRINLKEEKVISILGAGTGLGMARGIITDKNVKVLASEGGHKEFSPRSDLEWDLSKWLKNDLNLRRLSIERIVSGTGLGNVARWRLAKEDAKLHPLSQMLENSNNDCKNKNFPELVSSYANQGDPLMKEVVDIWLSAYGSVAGDLAIHELSSSGLWIAGGTAKKHLQGIRSATFLKALTNKGRFSKLLEGLPIMALIDPDAGLFGAACKAHLMAEK